MSDRGQGPRADRLQLLIIEIVQDKPKITCNELVEELRKRIGQGVIEDIDEETIGYLNDKKLGVSAPIKGLKDRLSRAKKKIQSR